MFLLLVGDVVIFSIFFCGMFCNLIGDFGYVVVVVREFDVVEWDYYCCGCFVQFFDFSVIWECDGVMFVF